MESKQLFKKLNALYFLIYAAFACLYPFLTPYLKQRGLSFTEIGIIYGTMGIVSILSQPVWGFITDKYSNKRFVLLCMMLACSLVILNLVFTMTFYWILVSIIVLIIFQNAITPVADAYSCEIIEKHSSIQYGKVRLMGSLGWAVTALVMGYVISWLGDNSVFYVYSFAMLVGAGLVYTINFAGQPSRRKICVADMVNLIKDYRIILFIISVIFVNIAMASNSNYLPILIENTGGDITKVGYVFFLSAISELPTFFIGAKLLKRYGEINLYIAGILIFAIRFFLNSICSSYLWVLAVQVSHGISFGLYFLAAVQYLNKNTPPAMRTSAMTLLAAANAVGVFIGSIGGGMLLEESSVFILYKVLAGMCVVSLLFILFLRKKAHHAGEETA